MERVLRKTIFAVPFGCLVALAVHAVRFGDDHAFGGEANEAVVAAAVVGSLAVALAILHVFLTSGTTTTTGTLAAARARHLIPGFGTLLALAASTYYGIESLEGHGIEIGLPTVLLAALAAITAHALRAVVALLADVIVDIVRDWLARLDRQRHIGWQRTLQAQPIHLHITRATRRLGRAPPNGQRLH